MAYSFVQYTGNGSTTLFGLTFSYISKDHISVKVAGVTTAFTWSNATTVSIVPAPVNAAVVEIRRTTPKTTKVVDFQDAGNLTEALLDLNTDQMLYVVQEAFDDAANSIKLASDNTWDATSKRIKNLAAPTATGDAVTKAYADTVITEAQTHANNAAASATSASTSASTATTQATKSQNYATKVDGYAEGTDNSSKSWAIGGTGAGQPTDGDAKRWASLIGAAVIAGAYSAKEWAIGTFIRGIAGAGSAKDWAILEGATVDGTGYSAKKHAVDAAASAATINLPTPLTGKAGKGLIVKTDETGYRHIDFPLLPINLSIAPTVAANALTLAAEGLDGSAPSVAASIHIPFRSATLASGRATWLPVTSTLAITVPSGATLGHNSGLKQYIYMYMLNNAGVVELAVSSKFFGDRGIVSTTAISGTATSGTVMYSTTARTDVPFICVGYTEDTQTTAGTWAAAPSAVHMAPFSHPVISFRAHRNGVDQTGIVTATFTKAALTTENYDSGGLFDAATNYRWVPPPGRVVLAFNSHINTAADGSTIISSIYKNGAEFTRTLLRGAGTGGESVPIVIEDECNGTDYYEEFVYQSTGVNQTLNGLTIYTFFTGSWSPQRS